jgi:hypothetical protein
LTFASTGKELVNKQPSPSFDFPETSPLSLARGYLSLQLETGRRPNPLQYAIAFGFPSEEKENLFEGAD